MQKQIKDLRTEGVLVYGIGITHNGEPVVDLFASDDETR
jgi:hypothetical protein